MTPEAHTTEQGGPATPLRRQHRASSTASQTIAASSLSEDAGRQDARGAPCRGYQAASNIPHNTARAGPEAWDPTTWSDVQVYLGTSAVGRWARLLPGAGAATRRPRRPAHQAARRLRVRMLALLSIASIVFSLAQFIRSSCAEPPATKSEVTEAVRQELQRIDDAAAAAASSKQQVNNGDGDTR